VRRSSEPIVHRAAFVCFEVTKTEPPNAIDGHDGAYRGRDERKHLSEAAVEQQRLVASNQKVIESKSRASTGVGYKNRHPINPVSDFVGSNIHTSLPSFRLRMIGWSVDC
jgi:hypothetical protein